jgi:hypothetical protein
VDLRLKAWGERNTVTHEPQKGTWAPRGVFVVTAKLPERDGEFEYRIRSAIEQHDCTARESDLGAVPRRGTVD